MKEVIAFSSLVDAVKPSHLSCQLFMTKYKSGQESRMLLLADPTEQEVEHYQAQVAHGLLCFEGMKVVGAKGRGEQRDF